MIGGDYDAAEDYEQQMRRQNLSRRSHSVDSGNDRRYSLIFLFYITSLGVYFSQFPYLYESFVKLLINVLKRRGKLFT